MATTELTIRIVSASVADITCTSNGRATCSDPLEATAVVQSPNMLTVSSSMEAITSYQWQICTGVTGSGSDLEGTGCTSINNARARARNFTVTAADITSSSSTRYLRVVAGTASVSNIASDAVALDRGGSIAAITGTLTQGQTLTAGAVTDPNGTVTGVTYQWHRGTGDFDPTTDTQISGATSATYTLTQADVDAGAVRFKVVASYTVFGGGTLTSAAYPTTDTAVSNVNDDPTVTIDRAMAGAESTATVVDVDYPPNSTPTGIAYQWQVCEAMACDGTPRDVGTDSATYTPDVLDADKFLRVLVSYDTSNTDSGHSDFASAATQIFGVTLSGISGSSASDLAQAYVDDTLTAGTFSLPSTPDARFTYSGYQWQRSDDGNTAWSDISGATRSSYRVVFAGDFGKFIRVQVTGTQVGGSTFRDVPSTALEIADRVASSVSLSGATVGMPSSVSVSDPDGMATVSSVTWQVCTTAESGCTAGNTANTNATAHTYTPSEDEVDKYLKATAVSYTGAGGGMGLSTTAVRITAISTSDIIKTVLPEVSLVIFDTIAGAVQNRVQVARGGNANPQLNIGGQNDLASIVKSQAELEMNDSRDTQKIIGTSSFAVTGDGANGSKFGFWGVGSNRSLSGESAGDESAANPQKLEWDGGLTGFTLGGDMLTADGKLFGIALNSQSGDLEVKSTNTHDYEVSVTSLTPYLGWTMGKYEITANLSIGSGDGTLTQQGTTMKSTHDLSMTSASISGSSGAIWESEKSALRAKADLLFGSTSVTPTGDSAMDESQSLSVSRLRLSANADHDLSQNLKLTAELGTRLDSGDGNGGLGVELGAGANFAAGNLRLHAKFRTLLLQTEDIGEFGLEFGAQLAPGSDGQGLSLQITPTYGQTQSGLANLWQNGIFSTDGERIAIDPTDYQMRVNARLGFGLAFPTTGLVTPYATARYGNSSQFGVGLNWKPKIQNLELDLLGERADSQQRILLKGSLGF